MRRLGLICLAATVLLMASASTAAAVNLEGFKVTFSKENGEDALRAGEHPFAMSTSFHVARKVVGGKFYPVEAVKDLRVDLPPGFTGIPVAVERCSAADFLREPLKESGGTGCADGSALGTVNAEIGEEGETGNYVGAVYNLQPSPGHAAKIGFRLPGVRITVDIGVSESPPYRAVATLRYISQGLEFFSSDLTLWGNPAAPVHDKFRGECLGRTLDAEHKIRSLGECTAGSSEVPFLVNPRACEGPLQTLWQTTSWQQPLLAPALGSAVTQDSLGAPRGFGGCGELPFSPTISSQPTSKAASSPSGLEFGLNVDDPGLLNPEGLAGADIEKAEVALPRGLTINPSQAEGLEVCSEAQLARESSHSEPSEGCPQASKIGTIEVETPLLPEELLKGSLFVATPYENPVGTLIAVYVVIKDPKLGIFVVQPLKVTPDSRTGQLIATSEDMPQLPFSHFRLRFREGGRAPLISPPGCGSFQTVAKLYPYSGGAPATSISEFQIISGPNSSPCPSGAAPFHPGFQAGTLSNQAGSYSPFVMRLTRQDGEQDMTKFSSVLPPGVVGRIAGIPYCPEAGIAQAASRSGEHGGSEEIAHPSCPAASQVGSTLAGAGVGSQLTYVPGKLYLAGPVAGDPLSIVAITPAVAGPFDAGTVVVRVALTLNPVTGEVEVDGAHSDPIPHILQGIPLSLRDLRVFADKPEFTLNATSCQEEQTRATLWGGGTALSPAPDSPVALSARYQAAGCASLGFGPKLTLTLKGGTKRGGHPALTGVVTPRPGDANIGKAVVTLPHSAFLEQAHIRTVCTRVQFAADACPKGSIYGKARAYTPLLDKPLQGPVYLRSSSHSLPDLVAALHGVVDIDLVGRIDSVNASIRSNFESVPDAPVSKFVLEMQGGKKGLIVNSRNLCAHKSRATADFTGQNGKRHELRPVVKADCGKKAKKKRRR